MKRGSSEVVTCVGVVVIVVVFEEDFAVEARGLFGVVLIFDFGEFDHVRDRMGDELFWAGQLLGVDWIDDADQVEVKGVEEKVAPSGSLAKTRKENSLHRTSPPSLT